MEWRGLSHKSVSTFERYLSAMEALGFSGAIIVTHGGELVLREGYGLADRESRRPRPPSGSSRSLGTTPCSPNQGWTQIPGESQRLRALQEVHRVLKPGGSYVFTAHPRLWNRRWLRFWAWQWIRLRVLKPLGARIPEVEFGDRLFDREGGRRHEQAQYIHIADIGRVKEMISPAGFAILECETGYSNTGGTTPVFFVCQKPAI